jgi:hypothetical protein
MMLRNGTFASVCALLLWMGGCPNRQGPAGVVVYVPAQAPAAVTPAAKSEVLVIEEPAPPPVPEAAPAPATTEQKKTPASGRRGGSSSAHATIPETDEPPPQETPETPPAEVPALEPRESSAQEAALREQVQRLQENVRQRMAHLSPARLSLNERKTLDDARTFLTQSTRAFQSNDLQRAFNLARKASLLVAALE